MLRVARPKPASSIAESTTRTCMQVEDVAVRAVVCTVLMHHASHLIPRPRVSTALKLHSAWEDQAARWGTVLHSHLDHRHACENEASGVLVRFAFRAVSAAMFEGEGSGPQGI